MMIRGAKLVKKSAGYAISMLILMIFSKKGGISYHSGHIYRQNQQLPVARHGHLGPVCGRRHAASEPPHSHRRSRLIDVAEVGRTLVEEQLLAMVCGLQTISNKNNPFQYIS